MTYGHTQTSPLWLILIAVAGAEAIAGVWLLPTEPAIGLLLLGAAALVTLFALSFKTLSVRDEGEHLSIRFGPIGLFRKHITYADMTGVEPCRSSILDGLGIHYLPGRGWIWNLWGFDCVRISLGDRSVRIGTDDMDGLVSFLKQRLRPQRLAH